MGETSKTFRPNNFGLHWFKNKSQLSDGFLPRPKDKPSALQCRGVVYKVGCVDCNFLYYEQTDRALETRLKEHERAVRVGDNNSKVVQHPNQFVHSIDFDHATIVDKLRNFHERLFLEAWYS